MAKKIQKCVQCGKIGNLYSLKNGKFACKDCLNVLAKEQIELENKIVKLLEEEYSILNPLSQVNALTAIAINIKYKNNLLTKEEMDFLEKEKNNMIQQLP